MDYLDYKDIKEQLTNDLELTIPGFDVYHDDLLSKIISTIRYSSLDDNQKRILLINILKSKKIIFFNYLNLKLIEEILDVSTYKKFLEYLKKREELEEIVLFNISPSNQNTIYLTTLENQKNLKK